MCIRVTCASESHVHTRYVCFQVTCACVFTYASDLSMHRSRVRSSHVCIRVTFACKSCVYARHVYIRVTYASESRAHPSHVRIRVTCALESRAHPSHVYIRVTCTSDSRHPSHDIRVTRVRPLTRPGTRPQGRGPCERNVSRTPRSRANPRSVSRHACIRVTRARRQGLGRSEQNTSRIPRKAARIPGPRTAPCP